MMRVLRGEVKSNSAACCSESRNLGFRKCVEWKPGHVRGQHWCCEFLMC